MIGKNLPNGMETKPQRLKEMKIKNINIYKTSSKNLTDNVSCRLEFLVRQPF